MQGKEGVRVCYRETAIKDTAGPPNVPFITRRSALPLLPIQGIIRAVPSVHIRPSSGALWGLQACEEESRPAISGRSFPNRVLESGDYKPR